MTNTYGPLPPGDNNPVDNRFHCPCVTIGLFPLGVEVGRARRQFENNFLIDDSEGSDSGDNVAVMDDSGSDYLPSEDNSSRGSSANENPVEQPLLLEEHAREDMPPGWGTGRDVQPHYVGPVNVICAYCEAVRWRGEDRTICCPSTNTEPKVAKFRTFFPRPPPPPLDQLLAVYPGGRDNQFFLERIRAFF